MYRRILITDSEAKVIEYEIHPDQDNLVKVIKHEIDLTFRTRQALNSFIAAIASLMDGNSITKVDVEEETV